MSSSCTFHLNKNPAVYYSGEVVAGTVILETTKEKNVRNVRLGLLGEAKVKWNEQQTRHGANGKTTTRKTHYKSHRVYIDNGTLVAGECTLPVGTHTYSFNIVLPYQCPTSCEGRYGSIRYELSLVLNRPFRFDNVYKKPLTVIQMVDLNANPSYKLPVVMEEISSLCCWPCNKGKLFTTLSIPFGAYAPGQHIKYTVNLQNQSMSDVQGYAVEFVQKYTFVATSPRHKERCTKNVLSVLKKTERCLRLTNQMFEDMLQIPSIPPSTFLVDSPIIRLDYYLKVTLKLAGCHKSAKVKMPIYIGTIPLRETLTMAQTVPMDPMTEATAPEMAESGTLPTMGDLKPPTFEEATGTESSFVDTDVDEHVRITDFRPLYPVYTVKQCDMELFS